MCGEGSRASLLEDIAHNGDGDFAESATHDALGYAARKLLSKFGVKFGVDQLLEVTRDRIIDPAEDRRGRRRSLLQPPPHQRQRQVSFQIAVAVRVLQSHRGSRVHKCRVRTQQKRLIRH